MSIEEVSLIINEVIREINGCQINNTENLFENNKLNSGDMVILLMSLKQKFGINIKQLIDSVQTYTVDGIAGAVCEELDSSSAN